MVHPAVLILKLDVLLLPGHPEHRAPAPGERACFRQATVVFSCVRDLHWTGQSVIKPAIDASGSADYGSVDSLTRVDNSYKILGDWGEINLSLDQEWGPDRRNTSYTTGTIPSSPMSEA